jgi:hypothetical protein
VPERMGPPQRRCRNRCRCCRPPWKPRPTASWSSITTAASPATSQKFVTMWGVPPAVMESGDGARLIAHVVDLLSEPGAFLAGIEAPHRVHDDSSVDMLVFKDGRRFERHWWPQTVDSVAVGRVLSFRDVSRRAQDEQRRRELDDHRQHGEPNGGSRHARRRHSPSRQWHWPMSCIRGVSGGPDRDASVALRSKVPTCD